MIDTLLVTDHIEGRRLVLELLENIYDGSVELVGIKTVKDTDLSEGTVTIAYKDRSAWKY